MVEANWRKVTIGAPWRERLWVISTAQLRTYKPASNIIQVLNLASLNFNGSWSLRPHFNNRACHFTIKA